MVICGTLLARKNFEEFFLSCSHCQSGCDVEVKLENWKEFVLHIKNVHETEFFEDNLCSNEFKSEPVPIDEFEPEINEDTNYDSLDNRDCLAEAAFVDLDIMSGDEDEDLHVESDFDTDEEVGKRFYLDNQSLIRNTII